MNARSQSSSARLLPLSVTLLLAAAGIPKVFPNASPRRVVQLGFLALFAGLVVVVGALEEDVDLEAALDDAGVSPKTTTAIVDENESARLDGLRSALAVLAVLTLVALFFSRRLPVEPASAPVTAE